MVLAQCAFIGPWQDTESIVSVSVGLRLCDKLDVCFVGRGSVVGAIVDQSKIDLQSVKFLFFQSESL